MPTTGSMPGIKAFTAAVFGGIGSISGAMIGGILLGIIEILGKAYVSTELGDAFVFAVLIVVLLVKPSGLLGKTVHEKCRGATHESAEKARQEFREQSCPPTPSSSPRTSSARFSIGNGTMTRSLRGQLVPSASTSSWPCR